MVNDGALQGERVLDGGVGFHVELPGDGEQAVGDYGVFGAEFGGDVGECFAAAGNGAAFHGGCHAGGGASGCGDHCGSAIGILPGELDFAPVAGKAAAAASGVFAVQREMAVAGDL